MMRLYFFVLLFISSGIASADMIPPALPMKCPAGAAQVNSHNGAYCAPTSCATNDSCSKEEVCQAQGLCIVTESHYDSRYHQSRTQRKTAATCGPSEACASGECEVIKRCVPKETKATPGPESKLPTTEPEPESETLKAPASLPESQPESTPSEAPAPPTRVDKGRCSVSAAESLSPSLLGLFLFFGWILRRGHATKNSTRAIG